MKRHIERAAHIAKAQSRLGSINRFVAAGCEIDKVTSAEIAFAIFIANHNMPMAVGDVVHRGSQLYNLHIKHE